MSNLSSWFSKNLPGLVSTVKNVLNTLLGSQKPKAKAFITSKADEFYKSIDGVTELATIAKLEKYLQARVGTSGLGAQVVAVLSDLITAGITLGMIETGLNAADALTRAELGKVVACINQKIDGAHF